MRIEAKAKMIRLDKFDPNRGLDRGASSLREGAWVLLRAIFFQSRLPWPRSWKRALLRLFGAKIGKGVVIKPRVTIHFPWKLSIGDHSWIGEEVLILNFEPCRIGAHCCVSQRAFLCGGSHNYKLPDFPYRNAPVTIGDESWICAQCWIGPGVEIGKGAVVQPGSVVVRDIPASMVCGGNPCLPIKPRWNDE